MIALHELSGENIQSILALRVADDQTRTYPRSIAHSIAEGHYPPDGDAVWMRAIYNDAVPVGFLMTSEAAGRGEYFLWRLMIDARHQRRGYGSQAVEQLIQRIERSANAQTLMTSHLSGDNDAGPFFRKLGFEYTGETLGADDLMMQMRFGRS